MLRAAEAVVVAAAFALASPSPASAATALLRNVDRGAQVELVDRGPCASAASCAWPAGGDWGPALAATAGDVVELTLGAPADGAEAIIGGGAPQPFAATGDARAWRLTVPELSGGDQGIGVVAAGEAFSGTLTAPPVVLPRPPGPPPVAFRRAVLVRGGRAVAVAVQASHDVAVTVGVARAGTALARRSASLRPGQNVVRVPLGPRARRQLRPGRHVAITIGYGASAPLRTPNAVLLRPR
jgi:hypothetical protein